jgi:ribosome recycling factor
MKATLEFDLPADNCEFKIATESLNLSVAVAAAIEEARQYFKYVKASQETAEDALQRIRDLLAEAMSKLPDGC